MGIINALNVMKILDREQDMITFRTSRAERIVGCIFIMAGIGMLWFLLISKFLDSMFSFCFFGFAVSVVFILLGLVLTTNKKIVIIDKVLKRIELEESCRFCYRVAAIHFDEIIKFELTKSPERLFSSHMGMWIIKAHVKRPGSSTLSVEKIYYSMSLQEAEDVAELLSASCHKETIINTGINGRRVALRIA